ncbi:hypothetical protein [Streptomyces sp. NPDC001833]|uniref:hypothetical protein n=1 Tax=Streptomyces sp. NPDC001833 TaxID=3154658 RepID=UPI00332B2C43
MDTNAWYVLVNRDNGNGWVKARNDAGDSRIRCWFLDDTGLDFPGCDWHCSAYDDRLVADRLTSARTHGMFVRLGDVPFEALRSRRGLSHTGNGQEINVAVSSGISADHLQDMGGILEATLVHP